MAPRRAEGAARLLWADYRARHAHRGEGCVRAAVLALPRVLADSSMHALVLLRVVGAGPPALRGLAQRCLLWSHGMYVDSTAEVGPGVRIPHPIAITLGPGATIAGDVTLYQNVTVKAAGAPPRGAPRVGAGARIYTGAVVCGPVEVGAGAMVGAGTVVTTDVPPGGRIARRHGAPDGGDPILALRTPLVGTVDDKLGLRELLAADHRARFDTAARASSWRLLLDAMRDRASRVTTIVRVMQAGPRPLWRLWRRVLLLHGCDVGFDAAIGAGLSVPCPIGVCVGRRAVLGAGVELFEHTTATPTKTSWRETSPTPRFALGDGVRMLPGAGAFGDAVIVPGAVIGPWALVARDVDTGAGGIVEAGPNSGIVEAAPHGVAGVAADGAPSNATAPLAGLLAMVRSDLDRLTGAGAGNATRRRAALGLPFHATVLMRLATCRRTRLAAIGRRALRNLHHCYVDERVRIGPGLLLPLPIGIRLDRGVRLGAGVTVYDRVSLLSDRSLSGGDAAPVIADAAVLGTGAVVIGRVDARGRVADGAVLVGR